jgi:type I restriction enzyme S subunit
MRKLGELVRIRTGKLDANANDPLGEFPFFTCAREPLRIFTYSYDCECILIAGNGDLNVKYYNGKFDAYQRTYIIESVDHNEMDVRYLFHFMSLYVEKLRGMSIGGVVKYIKLENLTEAKLPLPALSEQKRIAAILDKVDSMRAKRKEAMAQLDTLVHAFFVEMFGDPVTNPKSWQRVSFESLLENIDSGWSPICLDRPASENEWGVLKLGAVTQCTYLQDQNKALPTDIEPDPDLEVKPGDLLFSRKNTYDLVAACALVHETRSRLMLPDLIFRFRFRKGASINSCYIHQLFCNPAKRQQIQKLATGTAGSMPNISKGRLLKAEIEVPPILLQNAFEQKVKLIEQQKKLYQQSLLQLECLFACLQHRAFRGEL